MRYIRNFKERGNVAALALGATAFFALVSAVGLTVLPDGTAPKAGVYIKPNEKIVTLDKTFEVQVIVESSIPVNVFSGEIHFDSDILAISAIDYDTSVADLWAELPWYSNGDGVLVFGGGTTHEGGFQGTASLMAVTFRTLKEGEGVISIQEPRILQHNGLGTDIQLGKSKDAIFIVPPINSAKKDSSIAVSAGTSFKIAKEIPFTDLNADGKQSIVDISIFMLNITGEDTRYDFNLDGEIDIKDLNILLRAE
jgi:hypothetical protein